MKSIKLLTIILVVVSINFCFSQGLHRYGFKFGAVNSTQNWDVPSTVISYASESQHRWGIDVGGFAEWFDIPIVTFITEMHYIQKGITTSSNLGAIKIHYLSFPVLVKCTYPGTLFCPYLVAGGRVDFHLSTVPDVDKPGKYAPCDGTDYGATIGIGLKLSSILPFEVGAEYRYSPSFQNLSQTNLSTIKNTSQEILLVIGF